MPNQSPEVGAQAELSLVDRTAIFGYKPANLNGVLMLVKINDRQPRKDWLPNLYFVVITVVPWAALFWLIWPRG